MAQAADLPGAARLELVDGVVYLDPKPAMLEAMLSGWVRQQRTRFLNEAATIKPRVSLVRRLVEYTNAYPWEWTPLTRRHSSRTCAPQAVVGGS